MVPVWGHSASKRYNVVDHVAKLPSERLKLTNGNNNQEIIYQTTELLFYFKNKIQDTKIKQ